MSILVCWYISIFHIPIFLCSYIPNSYYILFMWLGYPLFYSFTSSISPASCVLILTCFKSRLSIYTILFIRSVTPISFFISLSLKNLIFKLLIRGVLCPNLIWWLLLFLIPFIRSSASKRHAYIVLVILLLSEIIPIYSRCVEKKLVYIIIIALFSHQPSSYVKCIKSNMYLSCNVRLVSNTKYI